MSTEWVILHAGALGDLALTLQLVPGLPGVDASATVHLLSRTDCGDLSGARPALVRRSPETLRLHWLYSETGGAAPADLQALIAGRRILNALSAAGSLVDEQLQRLGPQRLYSYATAPRPAGTTHITHQWRTCLERQGLLFRKCIHQDRGRPAFRLPAKSREEGHIRLHAAGAGAEPILIHPGSGGRRKCWPLPCFLQVVNELAARGRACCWLVGPVELDRWPAEDFARLRRIAPVLELTTPDDLLNVLAAGRVLLSNDAGPAHLAALIATPTLTVFGPSEPAVWRPLGPAARFLAGDPAASPADWGIEPSAVVDALERV